jgi:EmrB/QacA subfamily drug resistance transporter
MWSTQQRGAAIGPRRALAIAVGGTMLVALDTSMANFLYPEVLKFYPAISQVTLSWFLTANAICFAALLVIGGRLADHFGYRRVFHFGLMTFAAATLIIAAAPPLAVIIAARIAMATGAACIIPSSLALVVDAFPDTKRTFVVSVIGTTTGAAAVVAPALGAAIAARYGWHAAYLVYSPIALVVLALGFRVLPDKHGSSQNAPDLIGAALLAASLALFVYAIANSRTGLSTPVLGLVAFAASTFLLVVWRCGWHPVPIMTLSLFRSRDFCLASMALFAFGIGWSARVVGSVLFLKSVWGYSTLEIGLAMTPIAAIFALTSPFAGKLADWIGGRAVATTGSILGAVGLGWIAIATTETPDFLALWLPATLIIGISMAMTTSPATAVSVSAAPAADRAQASGVAATFRNVGGALGVALVVALVPDDAAFAGAYRPAWLMGIAGYLVIFALMGAVRSPAKPPMPQQTTA